MTTVVEALKAATKELIVARAYTERCTNQLNHAHDEESDAQKKYNTILANLKADLELEVTREMTDEEFVQVGPLKVNV